MVSYEDDEPDGLVQASFTIAGSSRGSRNDASTSAFPILTKYETNRRPSELRKAGFLRSLVKIRKAFEDTIQEIFDPLLDEIDARLVRQECPYFIPGCSTSAAPSKRLPALVLIGPQISYRFESKLKRTAKKKHSQIHWVSLLPRECPSLATTIQLLVARSTADSFAAPTNSSRDATSLSALSTSLPQDSIVAIHIRSLALHRYGLINDLVKSLQSASQMEGFPRLVLLFDVDGGSQTLSDKLDPDSLRLLDMTRVVLPAPAQAFEEFIKQLFVSNAGSATTPWIGSRVLELLQYEFFERGFDLDKTFTSVELALHHHFTTRPLSVMSCLDIASDYTPDDWTADFYDKLRVQIIQADGEGNVGLPRPQGGQGTASKSTYLQLLLTEDSALIDAVKVDYTAAAAGYRSNLSMAIKLLHALRSHFLIQATNEVDNSTALPGPRRSTLGGLTTFVMSGNGMRGLVSSAVAALRKAPLVQVEACLTSVEQSDWATEATFRSRLYLAIGKIRYEMQQQQEEEEEDRRIGEGAASAAAASASASAAAASASASAAASAAAAGLSAKDRIEMVQRRLVREESSEAAKRSIAEWCTSTIDSWTSTRPLLSQVFTYDFTAYLTQLIDPTPRANILAALHNPVKVLPEGGSGDDTITTSPTPDICRLYHLYQSAGRMINLNDWFQAFAQSLESAEKTPLRKKNKNGKKRRRGKTDGVDHDDDDDEIERKDLTRARFALAVNEMGKMGFLKRTRRKAEHVFKVVHDLPATDG